MKRKDLISQIKRKKSFLCIGLDTDINKIPKFLLDLEDPIFEFNKKINTLDSNEMELAKLKDLEESFEKETEFWQKSMNSNKINLLNKIENLINISINDYAIEEGYDLILYKDVAFVSDKVNITQQIIEKIEKQ